MENLFRGKAWKLDREGDVGILNFDLEGEKVNKFSNVSLPELNQVITDIAAGKYKVKSLLIRSLKKQSFIVGADISMIQKITDKSQAVEAARFGQDTFSKIEDLKIPTLAAIEGPCMGGGTELTLSCRYRICSDHEKTMIALPEVKLGILPGWGGTYRLPKVVGLMTALDMVLTGKNIRPDKAEKIGLVERVVPSAIFQEKALEFAKLLAEGKEIPGVKPRKESLQEKVLTSNFVGRMVFFKKAKEEVMKSTRGHYPSPLKSIELMSQHLSKPRDEYMKLEAQAFADLCVTDVSKNLVNLFFLSEDTKKIVGADLTSEQVKALAPMKQMAVLGAGVMGAGIAYQSAAKGGLRVLMKDVSYEAVNKGLAHCKKIIDGDVKKKRLSRSEGEKQMSHIRGQIDESGFGGVDLVIEAVVEILDVKKKVFADLETKTRPDCILASNTSSLRLADMAPAFKDPSRFVGLHFFNPVHKMPLVEVVTHAQVKPEVVARSVQYVKAIGKTPVVVKDSPGFLVNRLLLPWLTEAAWCYWEGYEIEDIDRALKNFGMPMGPFELLDEVGLDVITKVGHVFEQAFGERAKPAPVMDSIVASKRLGRKGGLGFYKWDAPGGKRVEIDRDAIRDIVFKGKTPGKPEYTDESIVHRLIFPMINEAAMVLDEGVVTGPDVVDVGMIFGTGFPPFRGGLLRYADSVGVDRVYAELDRLGQIHGIRLQPSEALKKRAKSKKSFY